MNQAHRYRNARREGGGALHFPDFTLDTKLVDHEADNPGRGVRQREANLVQPLVDARLGLVSRLPGTLTCRGRGVIDPARAPGGASLGGAGWQVVGDAPSDPELVAATLGALHHRKQINAGG